MPRSNSLSDLSAEDFNFLGDLADRLETAWRALPASPDADVDLRAFLPPAGDRLRRVALQELVKTDLACRWDRGLRVRLDYYLEHYPELGSASDLPSDLVYEECRLLLQNRVPGVIEELGQRYPRQFPEVREQIEMSTQVGGATPVPGGSSRPRTKTVPPRPATPAPGSPGGWSSRRSEPVPPVDDPSSRSRTHLSDAGQPAPPPGVVCPGAVVRGFRMVRRLGRGNFGEVWLAEDLDGGYQKAIKVVPYHTNSPQAEYENRSLELFKRLGAHHPYLVGIEKDFVEHEQLFIVMEKADCSLYDHWENVYNKGPMPAQELVRLMVHVAEGLDYLHQQEGVVHRDIKPQNILLFKRIAKVADFSLARQLANRELTMTSFAGTGKYSAPEMFKNEVSRHSDQYSLAITYAEMRLGHPVFKADSLFAMMQAHHEQIPDLSELPKAEQKVLLRALSKVPTRRYPTCAQFVRELDKAIELPAERPGHPGIWAALILIPLLLLSVAGFAYYQYRDVESRVAVSLQKNDLAEAIRTVEGAGPLVLPFQDGLWQQVRSAGLTSASDACKARKYSDAEKICDDLLKKFPGDEALSQVMVAALTDSITSLVAKKELAREELNEAARTLTVDVVVLPDKEALRANLLVHWQAAIERTLKQEDYRRARQLADDLAKFDSTQRGRDWQHTALAVETAHQHLEVGNFDKVFEIPLKGMRDQGAALASLQARARTQWLKRGEDELKQSRFEEAFILFKGYLGRFEKDARASTQLQLALGKHADSLLKQGKYELVARAIKDNAGLADLSTLEPQVRDAWLGAEVKRFQTLLEQDMVQALANVGRMKQYFSDRGPFDQKQDEFRRGLFDLLLARAKKQLAGIEQGTSKVAPDRVLYEKEKKYPEVLATLTRAEEYQVASTSKELLPLRSQVQDKYRETVLELARREVQKTDLLPSVQSRLDTLEKELPPNRRAELEPELKALRALVLLGGKNSGPAELDRAAPLVTWLIQQEKAPPHLLEVGRATVNLVAGNKNPAFFHKVAPDLKLLVTARFPEHPWPKEVYDRFGLKSPTNLAALYAQLLREAQTALDSGDTTGTKSNLEKIKRDDLKSAAQRKQYCALYVSLGQKIFLQRDKLYELRPIVESDYVEGLAEWQKALTKYLEDTALKYPANPNEWKTRLEDCQQADENHALVQACRAECLLELGEAEKVAKMAIAGATIDGDARDYVGYVQARLLTEARQPVKAAAQLAKLSGTAPWLGPRKRVAAQILRAGAQELKKGGLYPDPDEAGKAYQWLQTSLKLDGIANEDLARIEPEVGLPLVIAAAYKRPADLALAEQLAPRLLLNESKLSQEDRFRTILAVASKFPKEIAGIKQGPTCPPELLEEAVALGEAQLSGAVSDESSRKRQAVLCATLAYRLGAEADSKQLGTRSLKLYTQAMEYDPAAPAYRLGKLHCETSRALTEARAEREVRTRTEKLRAALALAEEACKTDATNDENWAGILLNRSMISLELGNYLYVPEYFRTTWKDSIRRARQYAQDALKAPIRHPKKEYLLMALGHAHEDLAEFVREEQAANFAAARQSFEDAAKFGSDAARLALGRTLVRWAIADEAIRNDHFREAEALLRKLAAKDGPEAVEAHVWLGVVATERKQFKEAHQYFQSALTRAIEADDLFQCIRATSLIKRLSSLVLYDATKSVEQVNESLGWLSQLDPALNYLKKSKTDSAVDAYYDVLVLRKYGYWDVKDHRLKENTWKNLNQALGALKEGQDWFEKHWQGRTPTPSQVLVLNEWVNYCGYFHGTYEENAKGPLIDQHLAEAIPKVVEAARQLSREAKGSLYERTIRDSYVRALFNAAKLGHDNKALRALTTLDVYGYAKEGVEVLSALSEDQRKAGGFEHAWILGKILFETSKDRSEQLRALDTALKFSEWNPNPPAGELDRLREARKNLQESK